MNRFLTSTRTQYALFLFIILHITAWTLIPYEVRFTLPMDSIEGTIWGHQLEWGYDKNPFVNAWLTALAIKLGGPSGWMIYLFSQLSVALCFWSVWQLGKKILPPLYAFLSVLLLEGMQYYNLHAIDFNDNTIELGLWSVTILSFYQALTLQQLRYWLLTGLFAGFCMMTKYYAVMLLLPMLLFLFINRTARQNLKNKNFYWGFAIFFLTILPHFLWLFSHDFVTVHYALDRVHPEKQAFSFLLYPIQFAWQQFEVLIPSLALFILLCVGKKEKNPTIIISSFDKSFLLFMGLGPFLLTLLSSTFADMQLRAAWGQPLLSLAGVMLFAWYKPDITAARFKRFLAIFISYFILLLCTYSFLFIRASEPSSANFPGKEIAAALTNEWHQTFHTPLHFVGGARWVAGNIAFYSSDHPSVYIDWNKNLSPWINEKELQKEGAIFIWDPEEDKQTVPTDIQKRFRNLRELRTLHFTWLRNKNMKPIEITVAFLPPAA